MSDCVCVERERERERERAREGEGEYRESIGTWTREEDCEALASSLPCRDCTCFLLSRSLSDSHLPCINYVLDGARVYSDCIRLHLLVALTQPL